MKKLLTKVALALALAGLGAPAAVAQTACQSYQVAPGDTLRKIARKAFGEPEIGAIYRQNRTVIGNNPDILLVGVVLQLPCIGAADNGNSAILQPSQPFANDKSVVSLATANGYRPYTDEHGLNRGLITQLVAMSMLRSEMPDASEIVFVNDWSAHLETLLPRQAFDASFPWAKPGCETQGELTAVELYSCQNYIYSDPIYQMVEGYFSQVGSGFETVLDFAGFRGAAICRTEGHGTSHLEHAGLMPPNSTLVRPLTAQECFARLMTGEVDLVAIDTRAGDLVAKEMGIEFEVVENPYLYAIEPVYAVAHKGNPRGQTTIEALNKGLKAMLISGEWESIVSTGLNRQSEVIMN